MLGLHHELAARVEDRGRAVAALLDVGRVGRADQHGAHLLARGAQGARDHLEGRRDRRSSARPPRHRLARRRSSPPRPPARSTRGAGPASPRAARRRTAPRPRCPSRGSPADRASASTASPAKPDLAGGPLEVVAAAARGSSAGPGHDGGDPDVDQLESGIGIAVAVAGFVLALRTRRQFGRVRLGGARHRQLERLALVAKLVDDLDLGSVEALASARRRGRPPPGPPARRSISSPRSSTVRVTSRRRPAAIRPSAESTPLARGQAIREMPSSSARAARAAGPAPPKGRSAKPRGSTPRSTVTTRSARTISWLATRMIPSAASTLIHPQLVGQPRHGPPRRIDVELHAARQGGVAAAGSRAAGSRRSTVGSVPPLP